MSGPRRLAWLEPGGPPDAFPDSSDALGDPNGLLAAGGDLSPPRLIAAYRHGIFPWFSEGQPILWWCPDPRAVLIPAEFHASRSLRRSLRSERFQVSVNQRFDEVIRLCSTTRAHSGTWLTPEMISAYCELHALGAAHSVETWEEGRLTGGVYGVSLGGMFFAESMFSLRPDASKVALTKLASLAIRHHIGIIDCQMPSDHLTHLGSRLMARNDFLTRLARLTQEPPEQRFVSEAPHVTRAFPED